MNIRKLFRVILNIRIHFAQTRLCVFIVVNSRCDVYNAISSEISMGWKQEWLKNCTGNYNTYLTRATAYREQRGEPLPVTAVRQVSVAMLSVHC